MDSNAISDSIAGHALEDASARAADRDGAGRRSWRILTSNIGYARGISGSARDHSRYFYRYFWCSPAAQAASLGSLRRIISEEQPDVCCLIEIDQGSINTAWVNQIRHLIDADYTYFDVENKYGQRSILRHMLVSGGKSNAFLAREPLQFGKSWMPAGVKRLIYKIRLRENLHLFFGHFSLRYRRRQMQFAHLARLIDDTPGEVIVMGDFNIFRGNQELEPLLRHGRLRLIDPVGGSTFRLSNRELNLDLCLCSPGLESHATVRVVEQPFSDHHALLLDVAL